MEHGPSWTRQALCSGVPPDEAESGAQEVRTPRDFQEHGHAVNF